MYNIYTWQEGFMMDVQTWELQCLGGEGPMHCSETPTGPIHTDKPKLDFTVKTLSILCLGQ